MKVKVRGLVFVGFAAAVFAQSAMADITPAAADKKVVASKYYVDDVFQPNADRVEATPATNSDDWNSTDKYPSMAVLKAVKDTLDEINVVEATNGYVDVVESPTGTFTLDVDSNKITSSVTSTNTTSVKLVTEGAVANYAQDKSKFNAATYDSTNQTYTSTIGASSANDEYPSSRNVYEFVTSQVSGAAYQPKVTDTSNNLKVGFLGNGANATPTWKTIQGASTAGTGAATDYVTINETSSGSGVYEVNLDSAQIADSIASDSSAKLVTENAVYDLVAREGTGTGTTINGTNPSDSLVPTVKNVYDFVSGGYQVKATSGASTVEVGHDGGWTTLAGGDSYVSVAYDGTTDNRAEVTLTNLTAHGVSDTGATPAYTSDFVTGGTKLARSGDVYDFVMDQMGGLALPPMSQECQQAAAAAGGGHYCALVYGATDDNGTLGLQWTIMAPQS